VTIVLAYDDGPGVGLGHRRRCQVIADSLAAAGSEVALVALRDGPARIDAPVVVVDSYRFRADDRARFRGGFVVALDDLARDLDVALVVDPAPGATAAPHRRAGQVLAGARYALVDPDLRALGARSTLGAVHSVLVAMGASDAEGVGAGIAASLREAGADLTTPLDVRLVVGPWGARTVPDGVRPIERVDGLAAELAAADVVVTAGGVTLLESLCLGRPTVVLALAANQRGNVDGVVAAGAALLAGSGDVRTLVARLARDPLLRSGIADAGAALIDGHGARRVADAIALGALRAAA
jgi:spore coat polysaccharide biosynthesis predicted glycosyltransferase SpsG